MKEKIYITIQGIIISSGAIQHKIKHDLLGSKKKIKQKLNAQTKR